MLTKKRDERYGTVAIQEETTELGLKEDAGCEYNNLYNHEWYGEGEQKISVHHNARHRGGTQIMRQKEDKRKYFFIQSTTGCCWCQKIGGFKKQLDTFLEERNHYRTGDKDTTSCLCNP